LSGPLGKPELRRSTQSVWECYLSVPLGTWFGRLAFSSVNKFGFRQ
jgi:hypothetical protein